MFGKSSLEGYSEHVSDCLATMVDGGKPERQLQDYQPQAEVRHQLDHSSTDGTCRDNPPDPLKTHCGHKLHKERFSSSHMYPAC